MSEESVKLLPCPFERGTCDHDALRVVVMKDRRGRVDTFEGYAECEDCGSRGPMSWANSEEETRQLAAYSWNARALSPAMGEETAKIDANDIWEALFSITKDAVPEELTNDVLAQLADWLNQMRRGA